MILKNVNFGPPENLTAQGWTDKVEHDFIVGRRNRRGNGKLLDASLNDVNRNPVEDVRAEIVI